MSDPIPPKKGWTEIDMITLQKQVYARQILADLNSNYQILAEGVSATELFELLDDVFNLVCSVLHYRDKEYGDIYNLPYLNPIKKIGETLPDGTIESSTAAPRNSQGDLVKTKIPTTELLYFLTFQREMNVSVKKGLAANATSNVVGQELQRFLDNFSKRESCKLASEIRTPQGPTEAPFGYTKDEWVSYLRSKSAKGRNPLSRNTAAHRAAAKATIERLLWLHGDTILPNKFVRKSSTVPRKPNSSKSSNKQSKQKPKR